MAIAAPTIRVEVQLTAGVWTNIAADVKRRSGIQIHYGIDGNRPIDCVAGTGTATFVLRNDANNSGATLGWYSPLHGSVRAGWTFGIACQIVFSHPSDSSTTVTITRSSQTATVTHTSHGKSTGEYVTISGANQAEYNGTWLITNTGANTYTYTVAGSPATPATGTITSRKAYVKHRGKIHTIEPEGNPKGERSVRVTSYDGMRDLAAADLREVSLLTDTSESTAMTTLLDSLPASAQPVLRSLDSGMETFPYVFDNLGQGAKALGVIYDLAMSAPYTLVYMAGDGTLTKKNRQTRSTQSSQFTFTNTMHGLSIPTTLDNVYNHVRLVIHKRTISADPTDELYSLPDGNAIKIAPSTTIEVWTEYRDPNDRQTLIGGQSVVTTLVAGTHYQAYDGPEGGADMNASLTATLTPFASTALWSLQNTHGSTTIYVTMLKVIGRALRDLGPQTYEAVSVQSYGDRPVDIDSPYLTNGEIAQGWATKLEDQYNSLNDQVNELAIIGNYSTNFMTQALAREPGDIITVSESLTGLSGVQVVIHSVDLNVDEHGVLTCLWGLATKPPLTAGFVLDTDQLNVDALQF